MNPASRKGAGRRDWPHAAVCLRSHFGTFDCAFTAGPGDATRLAREAAEQGRALVLTFGGDGTVSEAVRGLIEAPARPALGILPHGTGGDLARSLGLPTSLAEASRRLLSASRRLVDVGRVVFENGESRTFVNAASFGLSAVVAARVNRTGAHGYVSETVKAALHYEPRRVELSIDGGPPKRVDITSVSLHNGRFFGGGMEMAPDARLDDGRLEMVVVRKLSLPKLLTRAPLLYWGAHQGLAEVEHGPLETLAARPWHDGAIVSVEIDGESGFRLPARFEILERCLDVVGAS